MIDFKQIRNIVLDCDGVIFDSNHLKSVAFEEALTHHGIDPIHIKQFIDYHKKFGGISRYVKFEYLITKILCIPFDKVFYESLLKVYSEKSLDSYSNAFFTDGCLDFLEMQSKLDNKLFVASGSDEGELRIVFKLRKIDHYFTNIYGSPKTKFEILEKYILSDCDKNASVMIGDATSDMEASYKAGIKAIAMKQYSENLSNLCLAAEKMSFGTINTLKELI